MRTMVSLIAVVAVLISVPAFAADQPKQSDDEKKFSGEIQTIDLQSKTITLKLYPKKENPAETAVPGVEANASASAKTETNQESQTSTAKDILKTFTFDDKTEIAALEADEKATTTTKISDLDQGDEITVHLNDEGLIQKIEIIAGD